MSEQLRQLVWSVTTPGGWLPFDPWAGYTAAPDWTSLLAPSDVVAVLLAHQRVNHEQLLLLGQLLAEADTTDRPAGGVLGWGALVAHEADTTGVPLEVVDRDIPLTALLARVYIRAKAQQAAAAAAGGQ